MFEQNASMMWREGNLIIGGIIACGRVMGKAGGIAELSGNSSGMVFNEKITGLQAKIEVRRV